MATARRLTRQRVAQAERELARGDAPIARLIRAYRPCPLHRSRGSAFDILAWSIISQQLSTVAAGTIGQRVIELTGETRLTPSGVRGASTAALRRAGLSGNKTRFLQGLAEAAHRGDLNARSLAQLSDEQVMERLVALPGIGAWTAQMFLMFALRRADIFSPADVGLQRAAMTLYDLDERPVGDEFVAFAERWRPWRTVACWYLWRHTD